MCGTADDVTVGGTTVESDAEFIVEDSSVIGRDLDLSFDGHEDKRGSATFQMSNIFQLQLSFFLFLMVVCSL